jgi:acyl-CoA thioester hydrolase
VLVIAADEKRIHYFEELRHATEGWLSATSENMTLHVDMNIRRVAPFPPDIYARVQAVAAAHAKVPRPDSVGRRITMPQKR